MPIKKEKIYSEPRIARSVDGTGGGGAGGSGGGSMTVGQPVVGAGANQVLFADAAGNLKTVAQFAYVETTGALVVTPSSLGTGILVQGGASPINGLSNLGVNSGLFEMGIASGVAAFTPLAIQGDGILRHSSVTGGNGNTIFVNNNSGFVGDFIWSTGALGADTAKMRLLQAGQLILVSGKFQFGGTIVSAGQPAFDNVGLLIRAVTGSASAFVDFAAANFRTGAATVGTSGLNVISILNGTAPTTSPADTNQIYSADAVAGQSQLYARDEAGRINRLNGLSRRVTTQFDKTNDAALGDVTDLSIPVEAGRVYRFRAYLYTTAGAVGGVQAAMGGTATVTSIRYTGKAVGSNISQGQARATALGGAVANFAGATHTAADIEIEGTVVVNAAGTFTVQFAQSVSNGTTSSVLVNSEFHLTATG